MASSGKTSGRPNFFIGVIPPHDDDTKQDIMSKSLPPYTRSFSEMNGHTSPELLDSPEDPNHAFHPINHHHLKGVMHGTNGMTFLSFTNGLDDPVLSSYELQSQTSHYDLVDSTSTLCSSRKGGGGGGRSRHLSAGSQVSKGGRLVGAAEGGGGQDQKGGVLKPSRSHNNLAAYCLRADSPSPEDYNGNDLVQIASLARSLSAPRRCSFCNKMVLFKAYKCKQCRHRCHKKCGSSQSSRRNSAHKGFTGEEHWSKVLQANEVNSNLLMTPCQHGHSKHVIQHVCCEKAARRLSRSKSLKSDSGSGAGSANGGGSSGSSKDTNIFTTLYNRFIQWVNHRNGESASASASVCGSGRTTPSGDLRSRSGSITNHLLPGGGGAAGNPGVPGQHGDVMTHEDWSALCRGEDVTPADIQRWCHTTTWGSDTGSEFGSLYASSACSSLTMLSTTSTSECPSPTTPGSPSPLSTEFNSVGHFLTMPSNLNSAGGAMVNGGSSATSHNPHRPLQRTSTCIHVGDINGAAVASGSNGARNSMDQPRISDSSTRLLMEAMKRRHSNLTSTVSCPPAKPLLTVPGGAAGHQEASAGSLGAAGAAAGSGGVSSSEDKEVLCATWPPYGSRQHYATLLESRGVADECDELQDEESHPRDNVFSDEGHTFHNLADQSLQQSLGECVIPYKDLMFEECIRVGRHHTISRGRWHGEVMIHTYSHESEEKVTAFWEEVSRLTMIRHENIALFMGACIKPPHLAVITSVRKGASLYHQLHFDNTKLNMHSRVSIARQVAQGLGYLHHKGIIAKKVNSRNVYLEPKVKLCVLDHGMPEKKRDRPGLSCLPRGHLTYIAPEMLTSLRVESPNLRPYAAYTQHTDSYAFGTLLYELMSGHFPMKGSAPECIIWRVGVGHRQCLKHIKCNSTLKMLIAKCWKQNPVDRPLLIDINRHLQYNAGLHKRHSSSEPEALNRIGSLDF